MLSTPSALGSAHWRGSEVTRNSRQERGRCEWMLHDSLSRKGQGIPSRKYFNPRVLRRSAESNASGTPSSARSPASDSLALATSIRCWMRARRLSSIPSIRSLRKTASASATGTNCRQHAPQCGPHEIDRFALLASRAAASTTASVKAWTIGRNWGSDEYPPGMAARIVICS